MSGSRRASRPVRHLSPCARRTGDPLGGAPCATPVAHGGRTAVGPREINGSRHGSVRLCPPGYASGHGTGHSNATDAWPWCVGQ